MALAVTGLRFLVGIVLFSASVPKLLARSDFERAVENYRLLPQPLVAPVALVLPVIELLCGAALLVGAPVALAAACASLLLVLFSGAVAINLVRGREIDCGCAGFVSPRRISWRHVIQNLLLAGLAGVITAAPPQSGVLWMIPWPTHAAGHPSSSDFVAVAIAAAIASLLTALGSSALRLHAAAAALSRTWPATES